MAYRKSQAAWPLGLLLVAATPAWSSSVIVTGLNGSNGGSGNPGSTGGGGQSVSATNRPC